MRSPQRPIGCCYDIPLKTGPVLVHDTQVVLGLCMVLLGGKREPPSSLLLVLLDALPTQVHGPKRILRLAVPPPSRFKESRRRLRFVLHDPLPFEEPHATVVVDSGLSSCVPVLCILPRCAARLLLCSAGEHPGAHILVYVIGCSHPPPGHRRRLGLALPCFRHPRASGLEQPLGLQAQSGGQQLLAKRCRTGQLGGTLLW
mmetsp:Transcript_115666/g.351780  ORF Transcript_115666/g.351780 Transcript_115666/m.351780 type:complete len:201 (-) Transcript_115666:363-965(-)